METEGETPDDVLQRWVKLLDQTRCIGCHACTTACKSENEVPLGVTRTYVKSVDVGTFPAGPPGVPGHPVQPVRRTRRAWPPARPRPCTGATTASSTSTSRSASAARRASPPARTTRSSSTPRTTRPRSATCARTGWTSASSRPASPSARPRRILVGDLNDPDVAGRADRQPRAGHGPPAGEGHPARRLLQGRAPGDAGPAGGPAARRRAVRLGHPGRRARPAARRRRATPAGRLVRARRCCPTTCAHHAPWGWRVSLYTWTKAIAAGAPAGPAAPGAGRRLGWDSPAARWAAPALALALPRR